MARGQLGTRILEYMDANPGAHTIREMKEAIGAPSAGAIGYALDLLIKRNKAFKIPDSKPAKYRKWAEGDPVLDTKSAPTTSPKPTRERATQSRTTPQRTTPQQHDSVQSDNDTSAPAPVQDDEDDKPRKRKKSMPCGFCSSSATFEYHEDRCPRELPHASAGKPWTCSCFISGHKAARDYAEVMAQRKEAEKEHLQKAIDAADAGLVQPLDYETISDIVRSD